MNFFDMRVFLLLLLSSRVLCQIDFQKCYGGSGSESFRSFEKTSDGGMILAGASASSDGEVGLSYGGSDIWVVKLDAAGAIQWKKVFGGTYHDVAYYAFQTTDGGYIVCGSTQSNDGNFLNQNKGMDDAFAMKLNSQGTVQWSKTYGGSNFGDQFMKAYSLWDGGLLFTGQTNSNNGDVQNFKGGRDIWVVRTNSVGAIQWTKNIGGSGYEFTWFSNKKSSGRFLIGGYTDSGDGDFSASYHGQEDGWMGEIDSVGNFTNFFRYGGTSSDAFYNCNVTSDGNYLLTGTTRSVDHDLSGVSNNGLNDAWVIKINSLTGSIIWQQVYGGLVEDDIQFGCEVFDGYFFIGQTRSFGGAGGINHGQQDIWYLRTDATGNIVSHSCFGGTQTEAIYYAKKEAGEIIMAVGYTASNDGDVNDNQSVSSASDALVIKFSPIVGLNEINFDQKVRVYPIPTKDVLNLEYSENDLTFKIFNSIGQQEMEGYFNERITLNTSSLSSGVYIISLISKDGRKATGKFIKIN